MHNDASDQDKKGAGQLPVPIDKSEDTRALIKVIEPRLLEDIQLLHLISARLEIEAPLDKKTGKLAIILEYTYGIIGLFVGIVSIFGGIFLGLKGIVGSSSFTAKIMGAETKLTDAAPGVILFLIGLFIIWVTRPGIRLGVAQTSKKKKIVKKKNR